MQRFYFENLRDIDISITIKNPDLLNQIIKVLRVNIWDRLAFFNWKENLDYIFEIIFINKREVYLEKIWIKELNSEIDFNLNIFWALPNKVEKIEYIISKWVEVWVSNFYFFRSKRSQKLILSENKIQRLTKIIIEAVEQSWRSIIPKLIIEDNINIEYFKEWENIFFHTKDSNSKLLKDIKLDYIKWINLFIWPEWGFSDDEIKLFEELNFKKVYLWNRILRTETVWPVASFFIIQNKK